MYTMIIGGRWDNDGGRPSKLVESFAEGVRKVDPRAELLNGGNLEKELPVWEVDGQFDDIHTLFWLPDIPNDAPKLLPMLKKRYPRLMLIGSKRVDERDIGLPEVINRMLETKMNLGVIVNKVDGRFRAKLIDPLGNLFYEGDDFRRLGVAAMERVTFLASVTRVRSENGGVLEEEAKVPEDFLALIREYADEFDRLIPRPKKVSRFLGNAAFRCSHGFPAFRAQGGIIYVSKRNVDKSGIGQEGFVPVKPFRPYDSSVQFFDRTYGSKPSVDTPVNLLFFYHFPRINYLIHGHVYVRDGAAMTSRPIPCGAVEEFDEVLDCHRKHALFFGTPGERFLVNLKGHGFVAGAATVEQLRGLKFKARPAEERA